MAFGLVIAVIGGVAGARVDIDALYQPHAPNLHFPNPFPVKGVVRYVSDQQLRQAAFGDHLTLVAFPLLIVGAVWMASAEAQAAGAFKPKARRPTDWGDV